MNTFNQLMLLAEDMKKRDYKLAHRCQEVARGIDEWVSVDDRLPPIGDRYHAFHYSGIEWNHGAFIGHWDDDFRRDNMKLNGYTHWMPLPTPPKEA